MGIITTYFPSPLQKPLLKVLPVVKKSLYFGLGRYCPVCKSHVRFFRSYGVHKRPDAKCPVCGAGERQRLAWLFLEQRNALFKGSTKRILHIAPEKTIAKKLKKLAKGGYLSADIDASKAMEQMDITAIEHPDKSFDVIYCSHVLEHVSDDRKAMREFHRILADDGFAVIQVPIMGEVTFEDPSVTDPKERERLFGQHDHVRRYGPDFRDRLEEAGFRVETFSSSDFSDVKNASKVALKKLTVFLCRRIPE